jgi:hypothetical protein
MRDRRRRETVRDRCRREQRYWERMAEARANDTECACGDDDCDGCDCDGDDE